MIPILSKARCASVYINFLSKFGVVEWPSLFSPPHRLSLPDMDSNAYIDIPPPMSQPTIPPGIQPGGPADPQLRAAPATANPPGVKPAQPPADSRDAEAQRGM
jgi:hypothetical protein